MKKILLSMVAVLVLAVLAGWLAFVPGAKEPGYRFISGWGEKGTGPGQFNDPTGIAIAGDEVFVADSRNGRIQVFDLKGKFLRQFGKLARPMNLTIAKGELYVPEYFSDTISVFSLAGKLQRRLGKPGLFNAPGGVGVTGSGMLYVADFYNHRIVRLKPDGTVAGQLGRTGKPGAGAGEFSYPTGVTIGADGAVIVADGYNDRIQVFSPDGRFKTKWGGPFAHNIYGPFNGWFATVTSVATDAAGNIFAADFYNHRIQKFRMDGTFLAAFGRKGSGKGRFFHPIAMAIAGNGDAYVADFGNNRIQIWRKISSQHRQE